MPIAMRMKRDARRLLSARNLDDIPASVRIGSPLDVSDDLVYRLAAGGILHPATNYGVVYRVAFAPVLEPGEEPAPPTTLQGLPVEGFPTNLLLRLVFVFPPDVLSAGEESIDLRITRTDLEHARYQAWVLLTNRRVRWHYTGDGVPQVHSGVEPGLGGGVRFLTYEELRGKSAHRQITLPPVSGQAIDLDLFVFDVRGSAYGFGVAGSYQPENVRWYDFLRGRQG